MSVNQFVSLSGSTPNVPAIQYAVIIAPVVACTLVAVLILLGAIWLIRKKKREKLQAIQHGTEMSGKVMIHIK